MFNKDRMFDNQIQQPYEGDANHIGAVPQDKLSKERKYEYTNTNIFISKAPLH